LLVRHHSSLLDSRFRGNDVEGQFVRPARRPR
jgi:hypothetical protein